MLLEANPKSLDYGTTSQQLELLSALNNTFSISFNPFPLLPSPLLLNLKKKNVYFRMFPKRHTFLYDLAKISRQLSPIFKNSIKFTTPEALMKLKGTSTMHFQRVYGFIHLKTNGMEW